MTAPGSVSVCPPQLCSCSSPKWEQTPSVNCMRSKRAMHKTQSSLTTINIHLSQPLLQTLLCPSHPKCLKKAVQLPIRAPYFGSVMHCTYGPPFQSALSAGILAVYSVMYSCTFRQGSQKGNDWFTSFWNPKAMTLVFKGFTVVIPIVFFQSPYLAFCLYCFLTTVSFLYNLQMPVFSPPTDSPAIRRLSLVTLHTFLSFS